MLRITPPSPKQRLGKKEEAIVLLTKSLSDLMQTKPAFGFCAIDDESAELLIQLAWHTPVITGTELEVAIHTLDPLPSEDEQFACKIALQNTFRHSARIAELNTLQTRDNLCDGCLISAVATLICLAGLIPLTIYYHDNPNEEWAFAISQIFVVIFWVLIWHPVEGLVYDRLPFRKRARVCHRLDKARVSFVCATEGGEFEIISTATETANACSLL